jgi:hypothetical protein
MPRQRAFAVAALTACAALLSGCGPNSSAAVAPVRPAVLHDIPGSTLHRVVLNPLAVQRLGVATTPVTAAGRRTSVPFTALIYDPQGMPWVYVVPAPRTYQRVAVTVDRIDGDTVTLDAGPAAGTPVVDVGTPELLGAEYGVGEE